MKYVYILKSITNPDRHYAGITDDLKKCLTMHNTGHVPHTSKYQPWRLETAIMFSNHDKAVNFEKYLKSGSGRAFAKKRL